MIIITPSGDMPDGAYRVISMTTPPFLISLMQYASLSRGMKIGPEDAMCVQFANSLRKMTLEGNLHAVWVHPANELCFGHKTVLRAAVSRAMGMHKGISDYLFLTGSGGFALEAKHGKGKMTDNQSDFAQWCALESVPHRVFTSVDQGLDALREWGVIDGFA